MNDLRLLYAKEKKFSKLANNGKRIQFITFESNMGMIYATDSDKLYEIDAEKLEVLSDIDLSGEFCCNHTDNQLVLMQYLTESNNISLINEKGDLNLLNVQTKSIEGVGSITDGISGAQWSPDQELLALVSSTNVLILMTKDFDILAENPINYQNKGEGAFVNVGWGSYATQFKGSEGKKTSKEITEEKCVDWDDRRARVCWRSDGEHFLVHFIEPNHKNRRFQVFNREGALFSTIEDNINVLDATIAWTFSKSLIASSIYRFNKHEIIFFERNGLAHGGFELPFVAGEMKVKSISWNIDSSIMCVWSEVVDETKSTEHQSVVQLWTTANYYWYLKQSFDFKLSNKVSVVSWDPEDAFTLHIMTIGGQYLKYKLGQTINTCNPCSDYNGSIAVIDSKNVLITPFKNKIIPPPMSLIKLTCSNQVNTIIWSQSNMDLLVLLSNGQFTFYKYITKSRKEQKLPDLIEYLEYGSGFLDLDHLNTYSGSIQHGVWTRNDRILLVVDTLKGFKLLNCKISTKEPNSVYITPVSELKLNTLVLNLAYNIRTNNIAVQFINGVVNKYNLDDDASFRLVHEFKFPQPCVNFSLISINKNNDDEAYLGLTKFYRLYANGIELSNNCNSYSAHDDYLLLTDHTNTLKFISLEKLKGSGAKLFEESSRSIERGGKLVLSIHSDTACILQMPRGNLEAINPRTLLISQLKALFDSSKYLKAVEIMRKHRINMNIIFDHNPQMFLKNMQEFVEDLNDSYLINLFLTELNEEDTTLTFYRDHYMERVANMSTVASTVKDHNSNVPKQISFKNKIYEVCSKLVEICEKKNKQKFHLVILSCFAKMKELEKALYKIMGSKQDDQPLVDEGLRHLLYIVDVNELFDVALGTYDFDIVLMVAEKSQKDPKEYLPFLNDLKKLEENYRKYKIDLYLKRHKKALNSIVKCGSSHHDEIVKLADDQKLYSEALGYFRPNEDIYKRISKSYANHLVEKKYYEEAALILYRAENYEDSLDLFLKSSNWQMFINVCLRLKLASGKLNEKLLQIIEKLKSENRLLECATIYETYLNDSEEAILNLINGSHWFEAVSKMHKHNRLDFIETNMIPSLKSSQSDLMKSLDHYREKFLQEKQRLDEVRAEKLKRYHQELENELEDEFRNNDNMSVSEMSSTTFDNESNAGGSVKSMASTVNSLYSNKSTSKRRKQKKSLISLKKGSIYEDLALIQELSDTINYVYNLKDQISTISKAMLLYNLNEICFDLQSKYESIVDLFESTVNDIWNYPVAEESKTIDSYKLENSKLPTEFSKLDVKYRYPPQNETKRSWKLHFYN